MPERLHNRCSDHRADRLHWEEDDQPDWAAFFRHLHDQIDVAAQCRRPSAGPTALALAVVAEALAIGEAMSGIASDADAGSEATSASPAVFAEIDDRYLDKRTKALRTALHGVDDYIWWGSLSTAG